VKSIYPNSHAFTGHALAELKLEGAAGKTSLGKVKDDQTMVLEGTKEGYSCGYDVTDTLAKAVGDHQRTRGVVQEAVTKFYFNKGDAQSAAQVTQVSNEQTFRLNLLQIQQNQRIIELLEQIAKSGTGGRPGHNAVAARQ
jgi:hypothetical protein